MTDTECKNGSPTCTPDEPCVLCYDTDTTTTTVEIPADVKDNSPYTVRVQWRNTRPAYVGEVESGKRCLNTFGYTLYEWEDTDRDGDRVTLYRFVNREGHTVDLFATYYFTRVACATHDERYAARYASVTDPRDGGATTLAAPYCDECMIHLCRSAKDDGMVVNKSEPLRIGQHV